MDHVVILRKSNLKRGDNLLGDILVGTKTIESRWYVSKIAPWDRVKTGDNLYFKESGRPVTAKAIVKRVLQFDGLTDEKAKKIIDDYGKQIAPKASKEDFYLWWKKQKNKKYCILVFIENVKPLQPFEINKKGFGISSAWLVVGNIADLKLK